MRKPNGYERKEESGYRTLPSGGYVCKILQAKERKTKLGDPMIVAILDIEEGEYKGFFRQVWESKKAKADDPNEVKYPNDGIGYIVTEYNGEVSSSFNNFCSAIENSGNVIEWDDDNTSNKFCASLKGAEVGVVFGRVENEWNGKAFWQTKPRFYRSVESIRQGKFTVPADRALNRTEQYETPTGFSEVDMNIPF